jgi:uncharacterized protein YcfL
MRSNVIKVIIIFLLAGCKMPQERAIYEQELQLKADREAEKRIDSAYSAMKESCDSLLVHKVPQMADSVLREFIIADSLKRLKK